LTHNKDILIVRKYISYLFFFTRFLVKREETEMWEIELNGSWGLGWAIPNSWEKRGKKRRRFVFSSFEKCIIILSNDFNGNFENKKKKDTGNIYIIISHCKSNAIGYLTIWLKSVEKNKTVYIYIYTHITLCRKREIKICWPRRSFLLCYCGIPTRNDSRRAHIKRNQHSETP